MWVRLLQVEGGMRGGRGEGLMFAQDTSETPAALMRNHINAIGDSGGV